jgi:hypothetical protein
MTHVHHYEPAPAATLHITDCGAGTTLNADFTQCVPMPDSAPSVYAREVAAGDSYSDEPVAGLDEPSPVESETVNFLGILMRLATDGSLPEFCNIIEGQLIPTDADGDSFCAMSDSLFGIRQRHGVVHFAVFKGLRAHVTPEVLGRLAELDGDWEADERGGATLELAHNREAYVLVSDDGTLLLKVYTPAGRAARRVASR